MTNPKVIEEFFHKNLPKKIKDILDFSSIQIRKESYIDDSLKLKIVDMLFEAKFDGNAGFLYLLFEHTSKPHKMLPFRMLNYVIAIMNEHVKSTKKNKLPLVYPLILYSGEKPYTSSMDIFDLFSSNERKLAQETLFLPYNLIDLTMISDEELDEYLHYGTMARTLKHIHDPCVNPFFENIVVALKRLESLGEKSYINSTISYLTMTASTSNKDELIKSISKLETVDEEKIMTLAEHFKEEGRAEGREQSRAEFMTLAEHFKAEGREEGREQSRAEFMTLAEHFKEEGREKGLEEVARTLLAEGIQTKKVAALTGLSEERVKNLSH